MRTLDEYRHIFFDMDGTVTRSCTPATPEMEKLLKGLIDSGRSVMIISGQLNDVIERNVPVASFYMGQNGNHTVNAETGEELWKNVLTDKEKKEIFTHIESLPRDWAVRDENDLLSDRGAQIAYSLIGHNEDIDKKEAFDPKGEKRKALLEEFPLESDTIEVKIGGTTTFDYIKKGFHKGVNVQHLIDHEGWNSAECLYVGDALFPGGNDEAVIGVIDTRAVKGPRETQDVIKEILK